MRDCIPGGCTLSLWVPVAQRMNQHHQETKAASSTLPTLLIAGLKTTMGIKKDLDKVPENLWPPLPLKNKALIYSSDFSGRPSNCHVSQISLNFRRPRVGLLF